MIIAANANDLRVATKQGFDNSNGPGGSRYCTYGRPIVRVEELLIWNATEVPKLGGGIKHQRRATRIARSVLGKTAIIF